MTRLASLTLPLLLTSLCAVPAQAASQPDCSAPKLIRFKRGASSAVMTGPVLRGEDVCYAVVAKAGQSLSATVTSPDDNVEFQLYRPGYRITRDTDGPSLDGATVKGAGSDDDARHVEITLPATGIYAFLLGTERGGGAVYRLTVSIKR
jgi:hypothetical protein